MGYFFGIIDNRIVIMQTPPSSPMKAVDLFGTPTKGTPKRIRDESPERFCPGSPEACLRFQMPSPPKKPKVSKTKATLGLPILSTPLFFGRVLGKGSFGEVQEVRLPNSPLFVAVKSVKPGKLSAKILREEAANFGSPGCANGFALGGEDGTYYGFSSIAIPLNNMHEVGRENLESVIDLTKKAILTAPIHVIYDAKPENFGFIPQGTSTVTVDENGQPCVGPLTTADKVEIIDLGRIESPEEADKFFNPLLDDEAMETEKAEILFRKFKCDMMEALLRNQFSEIQDDDKQIVADICTKFGYRYAGGEQYQAQAQQLQF